MLLLSLLWSVLCVVVAGAGGPGVPNTLFLAAEDFSSYSYHKRIGIPEANRIRSFEKSLKDAPPRLSPGSCNTAISAVPYQAGLIMTVMWVFQSVCGGSLIAPSFVLTAAHCYYDGTATAQTFTVVLGSSRLFSGGTRLQTRDISVHPDWCPDTIQNDIAVIRIAPVKLTNVIQTIALPAHSELNQSFVGATGLASGFGFTSDSDTINMNQFLSSVEVPIISNSECSRAYPGWIHDSNLCTSGAGGRGTCHGDSGGPLAVRHQHRRILVGVTSFGSYHGCQAGDPAAFTRITYYMSWIESM